MIRGLIGGYGLCFDHFLNFFVFLLILGVSKNRGIPKWMVYKMEYPIKMDDLGGFKSLFSETPKW